MSRFEDRHRELRGAAHRPLGLPTNTHVAIPAVDYTALMQFEARTGPLVDDLVAELRRWFDIRQHRVDAVGDERMRIELLGQKMEAERRMYAKLAVLDEASRG